MKWLMWKLFGKKRWTCPLCGCVERVTWLKDSAFSGTFVSHECSQGSFQIYAPDGRYTS